MRFQLSNADDLSRRSRTCGALEVVSHGTTLQASGVDRQGIQASPGRIRRVSNGRVEIRFEFPHVRLFVEVAGSGTDAKDWACARH